MIVGSVTADGVPTISLQLADVAYSGVIDTGFNGDLELPERLRSQVNARLLCRARSFLAGGVTIDEDVYLVDFPFDGQTLKLQATFVDGDDILIGTHLLRAYRLTINFVARTIRLQRLAE